MLTGRDKIHLRLISIELMYYLLKNNGYKGTINNLARELGIFEKKDIDNFRHIIDVMHKEKYIMVVIKKNWESELVVLDKGKEVLQQLKLFNPENLSDKVLREIEMIKSAIGLKI